MIPPEYFYDPDENEARASEESTPLSELTDDAISIGAAYGIPSHVREFIRRNIPDSGMPTEEEIAFQEAALLEGQREMFNERFNQAIGAELYSDAADGGKRIDLTEIPLRIPNTLTDIIHSPQFSQAGRMIRAERGSAYFFVPTDMTDFEEDIFQVVCAANSFLERHGFEFDLDIVFRQDSNGIARRPFLTVRAPLGPVFELALTDKKIWSHEFLQNYLTASSNSAERDHDEFFGFVKSESALIWQICIAFEILSYSTTVSIPHGLARSSLDLAHKSIGHQVPQPEEFHELAERVESALVSWCDDEYSKELEQQNIHYEKDRRRFSPIVEFGALLKPERGLDEGELKLANLVLHAGKIFDLLEIGIGLRLSVLRKVEDPRGSRGLLDIFFEGKQEGSITLTGKGNWINFELSQSAISEIDEGELIELTESPIDARTEAYRKAAKNFAPKSHELHVEGARLDVEFYERQVKRILQFLDSPLSLATQCAWFITNYGHSLGEGSEGHDDESASVKRILGEFSRRFEKETGRTLREEEIVTWHLDYATELKTDIQIREYQENFD